MWILGCTKFGRGGDDDSSFGCAENDDFPSDGEAHDEECVVEGMQIVFEQQKVSKEEKRIPKVTEAEFIKRVRHVLSAKVQRSYVQKCKAKSMEHLKNNVPHDQRHYTFICDYSQNMSYPHLGAEQAGETY